GFGASLGKEFEACLFHTLEAVGAGPRLERTTPECSCPGLFDSVGRSDDLLFAFNAARPCDDPELAAADREAARLYDRWLLFRFPAGNFVGCEDRQHFVYARAAFDAAHTRHLALVADHGDHGSLGAAEYRRLEIRRFDLLNHVLYVLFFGITPHDD